MAYSLFFELNGNMNNYFGANCLLEVGSNYLRDNQAEVANGFIYKAYQSFLEVFGPQHSLLQKYYSYSSEVASMLDSGDSESEAVLNLSK